MPELPEVETIKNDLAPRLTGRCFVEVAVFYPRAVRHPSAEELQRQLPGQKITALKRRGKYLILCLEGRGALVVHLKMTGALLFEPDGATRLSFGLDDGTRLYFSDRRKLGGVWLVGDEAEVVAGLGPEPLELDFTPEVLGERLSGRSAPVKALLTDQAFLAGVGNMYADEALFSARLHPLKRGGQLSAGEVERLHRAIRDVLLVALETKGASVETYRRPDGSLGQSHLLFKVAHRLGQPCPVCATPIQRLPLRGRGTYFCPQCQRL